MLKTTLMVLTFISFLSGVASIPFLFYKAIRKQPKKPAGLALGISVATFVISIVALYIVAPPEQQIVDSPTKVPEVVAVITEEEKVSPADEVDKNTEVVEEVKDSEITIETNEENNNPESMPQSELELSLEISEPQPEPTPDSPAKRDNAIGISDKNVDNLNMSFSNSVRNDNVGNLRMAKHSDSDKFIYYAKSYVDKYFENDKEIHGIINFTFKTTTAVRKYDDMLENYLVAWYFSTILSI